MQVVHGNYEYAGFMYIIEENKDGILVAWPAACQHKAALKQKHRHAAVEQFENEYNWSKRKPRSCA